MVRSVTSTTSSACQSGRSIDHCSGDPDTWQNPMLLSHASIQGRLCEYNEVFDVGNRLNHSSAGSPRPAVSVPLSDAEDLHLNVPRGDARVGNLESWPKRKVGFFLVKVFGVERETVTRHTCEVRVAGEL